MRAGHTERLAAALIARRDFADAVRHLNAVGILPMPLKGVLLQHVVYQDPADRMLSDADLLVPPGRMSDALRALTRAGYRSWPEGRAAVHTIGPDATLQVDLHRRLFSPGLYGLTAQQLFARGRIDETLVSGVVVVPSPLDLYAHLVGNFAKGRHEAKHADQRRDFAAVASRYHLAPEPVARHLERHGLARAARYTLAVVAEGGDTFAQDVLTQLRADRVGELTATAARRLTARFGGEARVSLIAPHLLNRTLPRGAASVVAHVALGLRARLASRFD
ncbi:MAG: hypothetical protein SangKO_083280 [Sandaracinaceae bacterium]